MLNARKLMNASARVYDMRGQLLRRGEYAVQLPGGLVIDWDGRTNTGRVAPTGVTPAAPTQ